MHRRAFAIATTASLLLATEAIRAQPQGLKIRFVITRTTRSEQGGETRSTYENAVLLAKNERFRADFQDRFRLSLRPVSKGEGIEVEASLVDLELKPEREMTGQTLISVGQGSTISFQSSGDNTYTLGLLVTSQPLPKSCLYLPVDRHTK
jgi:hypothetical protein